MALDIRRFLFLFYHVCYSLVESNVDQEVESDVIVSGKTAGLFLDVPDHDFADMEARLQTLIQASKMRDQDQEADQDSHLGKRDKLLKGNLINATKTKNAKMPSNLYQRMIRKMNETDRDKYEALTNDSQRHKFQHDWMARDLESLQVVLSNC